MPRAEWVLKHLPRETKHKFTAVHRNNIQLCKPFHWSKVKCELLHIHQENTCTGRHAKVQVTGSISSRSRFLSNSHPFFDMEAFVANVHYYNWQAINLRFIFRGEFFSSAKSQSKISKSLLLVRFVGLSLSRSSHSHLYCRLPGNKIMYALPQRWPLKSRSLFTSEFHALNLCA